MGSLILWDIIIEFMFAINGFLESAGLTEKLGNSHFVLK